jgi:hypothetical protein
MRLAYRPIIRLLVKVRNLSPLQLTSTFLLGIPISHTPPELNLFTSFFNSSV